MAVVETDLRDVAIDGSTTAAVHRELDTSVGKALALLSAFDRSGTIGLSVLARRAGVHKSTAFRLLSVLQEWKLVEREGNRYRLGTKVFELGNLVSFCCPLSLRDVAHPFLEELYEMSRETVHLAVLDGTDVVYVDKLYGHNPVLSPSRVGGRVPAHCAGVGKAMLAFSDAEIVRQVLESPLAPRTRYTTTTPRLLVEQLMQIRQAGVAFDREEATLGLTCVAAPVRNEQGVASAAVSISGATGRFEPEQFAGAVRRAAAGIAHKYFR